MRLHLPERVQEVLEWTLENNLETRRFDDRVLQGHMITLAHGKYDHLYTFPGKIEGKTVDELVKSFHRSRMLCSSCKYNLR